MENTNENKNKDILNYESDYGKEFHERNLLKERMNIYVENLNVDTFKMDGCFNDNSYKYEYSNNKINNNNDYKSPFTNPYFSIPFNHQIECISNNIQKYEKSKNTIQIKQNNQETYIESAIKYDINILQSKLIDDDIIIDMDRIKKLILEEKDMFGNGLEIDMENLSSFVKIFIFNKYKFKIKNSYLKFPNIKNKLEKIYKEEE